MGDTNQMDEFMHKNKGKGEF